MAGTEDVVLVQLATRIPKPLHRERLLKPHCVTTETSVMDFVTKARRSSRVKVSPRRSGATRRHEL
jgi:hypothetical protein